MTHGIRHAPRGDESTDRHRPADRHQRRSGIQSPGCDDQGGDLRRIVQPASKADGAGREDVRPIQRTLRIDPRDLPVIPLEALGRVVLLA